MHERKREKKKGDEKRDEDECRFGRKKEQSGIPGKGGEKEEKKGGEERI